MSVYEEKYFAEQELERRKKQREKLEDQAKEMEALGTDEPDVAKAIAELGFSAATAEVFHILPLVHVAWADGKITKGERALIFRALEARGANHDHSDAASQLLASLLEERPGAAFMERSLELLEHISGEKVVGMTMCMKVAEASGGFFGIGDPVSDAEKAAIQEIASHLGKGLS